ncbi:MAG: hypothetical protein GXP42_14570 [Chloroflexi bacterium]|nr:hypothetical protein [Chloroflexota bacterium]
MFPTIQIGPIALPTGPLLLILGFWVGLWVAAKVGERRGIDPDHLYNAGFYAAVAAIIAGRLGHVIRYFPAYRGDPLSVLNPNLSAFLPLAAVLAALAVLAWYQRRYQIPIPALLDALALGALALLASLALADFLNARNFGSPTLMPWAVTQWSVARHPVQLYELLGILIVLGLLWARLEAFRPGRTALVALGGYAAVRLIVDAFRDQPQTIGDGFRLSQVIALIVLLIVLLAFYQMQVQAERSEENASASS